METRNSPFGTANAEFDGEKNNPKLATTNSNSEANQEGQGADLKRIDAPDARSSENNAQKPDAKLAEGSKSKADGKTFDLEFGIEVDGKTYLQLHLRRAKAKDRRAMARIEDVTEQQATLIANLASIPGGPGSVPLEAIDELDMADYTLLSAYVNQNFFGLKQAS